MKENTWFDYHFGGWLWLIRYKIANFVIGYNIEDALEEHMANGWEECAQEAYDHGMLHDITFEDIQTLNPYRQGEKIILSNNDYDQLRKALDEE